MNGYWIIDIEVVDKEVVPYKNSDGTRGGDGRTKHLPEPFEFEQDHALF
jgi:hypothetical protein